MSAEVTKSPEELQYDIEVDPLAPALQGIQLNVGVSDGDFGRLGLGYFQLTFPGFLLGDEAFESDFRGVAASWDAQPIEQAGIYYGTEAAYSWTTYRHKETNESEKRQNPKIGLRIGYRYFFGNFYLAPWVAADYFHNNPDVTLADKTLPRPTAQLIPHFHIGYKW